MLRVGRHSLLFLLCGLAAVQLSTQQCSECIDFIDLPELKTSTGSRACEATREYNKYGEYHMCNHDFECSNLQQLPDFSKLCHVNYTFDDIRISDSDIGSLGVNAFSGVRLITDSEAHVWLQNCQIQTIEKGAFGNSDIPEKLYDLSLKSNLLSNIDAILDLTNVKIVNLNGNKLTSLPAAMATSLTKLTNLYLADNLFTEVPPAICDFPSIIGTDVGGTNPITGDLADYVNIFVKCERGIDVGWGRSTMDCMCDNLYQYPAANTRFKLSARCNSAVCGGNGPPVTCSPRSDEELVAQQLTKLDTADVWDLCPKGNNNPGAGGNNAASKMAAGVMAAVSPIIVLLTRH